jgi:hypothetical protein
MLDTEVFNCKGGVFHDTTSLKLNTNKFDFLY